MIMKIMALSIFFCPFCMAFGRTSHSPSVSSSTRVPMTVSPSEVTISPSHIPTATTHCPDTTPCGNPAPTIPPPTATPSTTSTTAVPPTPPSLTTISSTPPSSAFPTNSSYSYATTTSPHYTGTTSNPAPPNSTLTVFATGGVFSGGAFVLEVPTWRTFIWVGIGLMIMKGLV
ncbi:hypothetical protein JAAARDRAFT_402057 [Jaapia argillacea MUCL 33604]|uniref:Uncharacterized protein n=1 Tax=Jaapia argillacea MUCL 33604 TaxID=933084 RepID=A0A067PLJ4_9AGAM|nr:hypothetical protein JAAARDRAFT_402057 [Jaapia argillacea MUCL 33604]